MKKEESEGWEEQARLKKNQVEMKNRDNLIKITITTTESLFTRCEENKI